MIGGIPSAEGDNRAEAEAMLRATDESGSAMIGGVPAVGGGG